MVPAATHLLSILHLWKSNILLRQGGFRSIQWKTKVFFAESQPGILLGQKGFLERFKVILDGQKKEVEINA